jgi:PAS domain S-box-containing protein
MSTTFRHVLVWPLALLTILAAVWLWWTATVVAARTARNATLVQGNPAITVVMTLDGNVRYVTDNVYAYTGYTSEDIQSGGVELLVPVEFQQQHLAAVHRFLANHVEDTQQHRILFACQSPVLTKKHEYLACSVTIAVVQHEAVSYIVGYITPLPERVLVAKTLTATPVKNPRLHAPTTLGW